MLLNAELFVVVISFAQFGKVVTISARLTFFSLDFDDICAVFISCYDFRLDPA